MKTSDAGDIMSNTLVAVRRDAPLLQVLRLMVDNRISGVPVLGEAGDLVGILTEGDLLRRAELGTDGDAPGKLRAFFFPDRLAGDYIATHGRRAGELMTTPVMTVAASASLAEIAASMHKHRVKRLPVTRNGLVVGIVSRADLIRTLLQKIEQPEANRADAEVHDAISKELHQQEFLLHRAIAVSVTAESVDLDGIVFDIRQRNAAQVVAENFAGTRPVENRLVVVDPNSGMIVLDPASR